MAAESGETWDYPMRDDDMDEPPPPPEPTPEEADVDFWTHELPKQFDGVADGEDVVWQLQHVLKCFVAVRFTRSGPRPSRAQRDTLLRAIARAKVAATDGLPPYYSRSHVEVGFEAAQTLAVVWAKTDEERASYHPDVITDAYAFARMLRRDTTNIMELERIRQRSHTRRAETIKSLSSGAVRRGAA